MMPASIPDLHSRSRTKILPLPITCLAVPSIYEEPQGIYLQRPSSPPQAMSPPPPPLQVEPLKYQRANALGSDTIEYQSEF